MEIDATTFPHHLLDLIINISDADFVSFDLELSGIPSRLPHKPKRPPGRLTLEERYAETKAGADRYQILQVGLTCVKFDYIADKYVLRPYNINISPLLDERLDFEREITFQSGACTFLLNNGFDLGAPFAKGVQYLSRQEAERAKQMAWDRIDKKNPIEDLQLKDEHVESLDFLRRAREAIMMWKTGTSSYLDITTHTGFKHQPTMPAISRFEKRLVHQLVRAEFPEHVSMGRADCVRIIDFNPEREAENKQRIKNRVTEQIIRQTGFRWVFEALVKGGHLDPSDVMRANTAMPLATDSHATKARFDRAVERLKSRQPVLVGHNMFTDIVYFYRTFVGELPDTLQGFRDAIHDLFPKIIDTKYLATYAEGDLNASPTLQEIAEGLNKQLLPHMITHVSHSKYEETERFHEAGYDSLLTATIMLRLAAKLGAERNGVQPLDDVSDHASFMSANPNQGDIEDFARDGREKLEEPVSLPPVEKPKPRRSEPATDASGDARKHREGKKKKSKRSKPVADQRFQTKNIFDSLRELQLDPEMESESSIEEEPARNSNGAQASRGELQSEAAGSWESTEFVQDTTGWVPVEQIQRQALECIPNFDSIFWEDFGNKLRVFGTQEAVLTIAGW